MSTSYVSSISLPESKLWENRENKRALISFEMEITARCNNNCRHCYVNLPDNDNDAEAKELSLKEIKKIVDEAVSLGAMWCLITGGEPLLRKDFFDIYLYLKKKGLLISVFTNATLITRAHIRLFKNYPPRDLEVSVYGVSKETYESVTRKSDSFKAFIRGLELLLENGIKVRLKAMALRSNLQQFPEIALFCRKRTKDYFRLDPFLHLRSDRSLMRNEEIKSERLSPEEIVDLERSDHERIENLKKGCEQLIIPSFSRNNSNRIFQCGTGNGSFFLSYSGIFRLCSSLIHPDCIFDLKEETLTDVWHEFVPGVRNLKSSRKEFLENCQVCPLINLCMWCPASAYLETGEMDKPVEYFCRVANARASYLVPARKS